MTRNRSSAHSSFGCRIGLRDAHSPSSRRDLLIISYEDDDDAEDTWGQKTLCNHRMKTG